MTPKCAHIQISVSIYLSQIQYDDTLNLVHCLNDPVVAENTTNIPYPYTPVDAEQWVTHVAKRTESEKMLSDWAIRDLSGKLVGGVGFHRPFLNQPHRNEIGYWLSKEVRGQGLMTSVVSHVCELGFSEMDLVRVEAIVLCDNIASIGVLERCGFRREGVMQKYICKNGRYKDAFLYAKLKEC